MIQAPNYHFFPTRRTLTPTTTCIQDWSAFFNHFDRNYSNQFVVDARQYPSHKCQTPWVSFAASHRKMKQPPKLALRLRRGLRFSDESRIALNPISSLDPLTQPAGDAKAKVSASGASLVPSAEPLSDHPASFSHQATIQVQLL